MAPLFRVEITADQAIQVSQEVQVEGAGDAERVGISLCELLRGLDQIDTDQQPAARGLLANAAQKHHCLSRREVANARPGIEEHGPAADSLGRQIQRCGKVHAESPHVQRRVLALDAA